MNFLDRIQSYIPNEMEAFMESLSHPMYQGLRINTKKIDKDTFVSSFPYIDEPSPFCENGFYVSKNLGNHPFHISGLYYLQEPSATSAVEVLDVQEDDVVLDLCAAPGGKSTQIASKLTNGYLISNEIDAKRCQILLSNMERMGVMNVAITNSTPSKICSTFKECFDKILVDAPCSGEGMMKKHSLAKDEWSYENILFCAKRQKEILSEAYKALKEDGYLVYSTCTYAKEENEEVVSWFLSEYEDMELVSIDLDFGRMGLETEGMDHTKVRRIFPMDHGEGHFVTKFHKTGGGCKSLPTLKSKKVDKLVSSFMNEQLYKPYSYYYINGESVYCMNREFVDFKKIKCIRQGLYCGNVLKNRFEPAHAFYMNADIKNLKNVVDVSFSEMEQFVHGLEIEKKGQKGYVGVSYQGYPFGYGKCDGMRIKNKIPKGLRLMQGSSLME